MEDRQYRKISDEELKEILNQHELWLKTGGKDGKIAELQYIDLMGKSLENRSLACANLSGSNISKSNLTNVRLFEANLSLTNLEGADLKWAELRGTQFIGANLRGVDFHGAIISNTNFELADLRRANFDSLDLRSANFNGANLENTILNDAIYTKEQLKQAKNVPINYLNYSKYINTTFESGYELEKLQDELKALKKENQEARGEASLHEEENRKLQEELIKQKEEEEKRLQEVIEKEQKAKEDTNDRISKALQHLETPNQHLQYAVGIQYGLASVFLILVLIGAWNIMSYINTNYEEFKLALNNETTFLQWFFYVSPIILGISLVITLINQINNRLKRIIELQERKRYVGSINGALNAIHILSDNNEQSKIRINQVLDQIVENTVQLTESINKPIQLEEKEMDNIATRVIEEMTKNLKK